jgi:hypothetical protein
MPSLVGHRRYAVPRVRGGASRGDGARAWPRRRPRASSAAAPAIRLRACAIRSAEVPKKVSAPRGNATRHRLAPASARPMRRASTGPPGVSTTTASPDASATAVLRPAPPVGPAPRTRAVCATDRRSSARPHPRPANTPRSHGHASTCAASALPTRPARVKKPWIGPSCREMVVGTPASRSHAANRSPSSRKRVALGGDHQRQGQPAKVGRAQRRGVRVPRVRGVGEVLAPEPPQVRRPEPVALAVRAQRGRGGQAEVGRGGCRDQQLPRQPRAALVAHADGGHRGERPVLLSRLGCSRKDGCFPRLAQPARRPAEFKTAQAVSIR